MDWMEQAKKNIPYFKETHKWIAEGLALTFYNNAGKKEVDRLIDNWYYYNLPYFSTNDYEQLVGIFTYPLLNFFKKKGYAIAYMYLKKTYNTYNDLIITNISLNYRYDVLILENQDRWRDLIAHEMAHYIANIMYRRNVHHNIPYQIVCHNYLKNSYDTCSTHGDILNVDKTKEIIKYKYYAICVDTGNIVKRYQKKPSKNWNRWVCKDGSKIIVLTVDEYERMYGKK